MKRKLSLALEYDGTNYHGFQVQSKVSTIQNELEIALWKLTGEKRRVVCASRTDAGVHAKGQVVCFRASSNFSPETFVKALNFYLPEDIAVKNAHEVNDDFDARKSAISREYSYVILNSKSRSPLLRKRALLVPNSLNVDAMNRAVKKLLGTHDFASFTCPLENGKSTIRTVHKVEVYKKGELVLFEIVASSFLPQQIRRTVGTLIKVGLGKIGVKDFEEIVKAKRFGLAGPSVPSCGLYLMKVNYRNEDLQYQT